MTIRHSGLRELVGASAERNPQGHAVLGSGFEALEYGQLLEQVDGVGRALRSWGVARRDRVAVVLPNGPCMATVFVGIAAHAECAPLNPAYTRDELVFFLTDLAAKAVVIPEGVDLPAREVAASLGLKVIEVESSDRQAGAFTLCGAPEHDGDGPVDWGGGDDIAMVLHTSGTTSRPKQVPLSHRNLCESAANIADVLMLSGNDRCLNVMPLFHIHGLVGTLLSSLQSGASVICAEGYEGNRFVALMSEFEPTWFSAVPTIHQSVLAAVKETPTMATGGHLRMIRSSSSALPPSVMVRLEEVFGVPVIESYGMTEAAHQMASNPLPPAARKAGSVGLPAGPEMAIMGDGGELLEVGEIGEIVIRGSNITAGYVNNDEANESAFTDGWFRTGDLGRTDDDGYFFLTGRTKEMINRGGENISPREIDEVLLEHSGVIQAVAFAVPHSTLGEDLAVAVVREKGASVTEQELREFAFDRLAEFKVPSQVVFVDEIPKGPTGKLQRIGLGEKLSTYLQPEDVRPEGPVESELAALWCIVLDRSDIGRNSNFFACGGDSLMATRLVSRLRTKMGVEFGIAAVFRQPVLHAQASLISAAKVEGEKEKDQEMAAMLNELDGLSDEEAAQLLAEEGEE